MFDRTIAKRTNLTQCVQFFLLHTEVADFNFPLLVYMTLWLLFLDVINNNIAIVSVSVNTVTGRVEIILSGLILDVKE